VGRLVAAQANPAIRADEAARAAALDLLEKHWADEHGQVSFPVDPVVIASRLEVEVVRGTLDKDVAGLLIKEPDEPNPKIFLNRRDDDRRQRFTCAHELGHLSRRGTSFLRTEKVGFIDSRDSVSGEGTDPEEVWANKFAAELLMPAVAVRTWWSQGLSVPKVARIFGVSEAAMQVRLASLRLS